jgi:GNAT superfamily N-acetyltransferase
VRPLQVLIKPLSEAALPGFLAFFDREAFGDNPAWSSCYCQCFYEDHRQVDWAARSLEENRNCAVARCRAGDMRGYLAYFDERVVGWCNAAPRAMLHALDAEPIADASITGSVLCFFLVEPAARGRGVARALLDAACEGLRSHGLSYAEANPRPQARSDAENHWGPLAMFLSAGFSIDREDDDGSVWVRKRL